MTDEAAETVGRARDLNALRAPFPAGTVGKLPRNIKKNDNDRGKCQPGWKNNSNQPISADGYHCGGYHARSIHLDYVGHAAVTDRLLEVDPEWDWAPMATDELGLPALDREGNLWIRLTVCGITRLGVGDGPNMKERIGDALRNAAMRFGVALALWSKEDLESGAAEILPPDHQPEAPDDRGAATPVKVSVSEADEYSLAKDAAWTATARHGDGNAQRLAVLDDVLKTRGVDHSSATAADFMAAARELNTGEVAADA